MVLAFDAVKKSYVDSDGEVPVLRGVSFELPPGATLALTGESGSGKSTVLHIAGGLEAPTSGRVQLAGQDVTALNDAGRAALRRNEISLVFQQFNLVPSLTVAANIS
ncbi:MAG: ATP-binding cassette domain-containing protein, partial [Roseovarius gahaiensis]